VASMTSKYEPVAWVRNPQGGREDSPDGRFILTGDTGDYTLEDTVTGERWTGLQTIRQVRDGLLSFVRDEMLNQPLTPEQNAEMERFLTSFERRD